MPLRWEGAQAVDYSALLTLVAHEALCLHGFVISIVCSGTHFLTKALPTLIPSIFAVEVGKHCEMVRDDTPYHALESTNLRCCRQTMCIGEWK